MRTIRHQTVNVRHQFGAYWSAVRTETQGLEGDADAKNEIIYSRLSYSRDDSWLILGVEQIDPVFSPIHSCGARCAFDAVLANVS